MENHELRARLNNLILAGQNEDGELEWIGKRQEWDRVEAYLRDREQVEKDIELQKRRNRVLGVY